MEDAPVNIKISIDKPTAQTRGYAKRIYYIGKWDAMQKSGKPMGYTEFKEIIDFLAPLVTIEGKPPEVSNQDFLWDIASEEQFTAIIDALKGEASSPVPPQQSESSDTP